MAWNSSSLPMNRSFFYGNCTHDRASIGAYFQPRARHADPPTRDGDGGSQTHGAYDAAGSSCRRESLGESAEASMASSSATLPRLPLTSRFPPTVPATDGAFEYMPPDPPGVALRDVMATESVRVRKVAVFAQATHTTSRPVEARSLDRCWSPAGCTVSAPQTARVAWRRC